MFGTTAPTIPAPPGQCFTPYAFEQLVGRELRRHTLTGASPRGRLRSAYVASDGESVTLCLDTETVWLRPERLSDMSLPDGTPLLPFS